MLRWHTEPHRASLRNGRLIRGKLSRAEPHGSGLHSAGNPIQAAAARQPDSLITAAPVGGFGYSARAARLLPALNFPDITPSRGKMQAVESGGARRYPGCRLLLPVGLTDVAPWDKCPGTSPGVWEEAAGGHCLVPWPWSSSLWGAAALPLPQPHPMLLRSSCISSFPAGTFGREMAPAASPKVFWGVCFYKSSAMKPSPPCKGEEWRENSALSCPAALHLMHEDPRIPKKRLPCSASPEPRCSTAEG